MDNALKAFLTDNPQAFSNIHTLEDAEQAVRLLIKEKMPIKEVVERIFWCPFAEELIKLLVADYRGGPTFAAVLDEIVNAVSVRLWEEFDLETLRCELQEESNVLLDKRLVAKIQHHIAKRDYKRAWDGIKAYHKNARSKTKRVTNLRALAVDLYEYMVTDRLITPVQESDYTAQHSYASFTSYDVKPRARDCRPAMQCHTRVNRPGWAIACCLGYRKVPEQRWLTDLTAEGAMVLKVGAYLRNKRNEERRQLHLAACEAYDRAHQATK